MIVQDDAEAASPEKRADLSDELGYAEEFAQCGAGIEEIFWQGASELDTGLRVSGKGGEREPCGGPNREGAKEARRVGGSVASGQRGAKAPGHIACVAGDIAVDGSIEGARTEGGASVIGEKPDPSQNLVQSVRREKAREAHEWRIA
jgi:hypothetical protein